MRMLEQEMNSIISSVDERHGDKCSDMAVV